MYTKCYPIITERTPHKPTEFVQDVEICAASGDDTNRHSDIMTNFWTVFTTLDSTAYSMIRHTSDNLECIQLALIHFTVNAIAGTPENIWFETHKDKLETLTTTGEKLRYYRHTHALRQEDVAKLIGIDRGTYIHYEDPAKQIYPPDHLQKLADLYGIPLTMLADEYYVFLNNSPTEYIRHRRDELGISQFAYSKYLGIPLHYVKNWERGSVRVSRASWEKYFHMDSSL